MAKVIVYDEYTNRLFTYNLSENDPMPYAYGDDARHGGMEPYAAALR